MRYLLIFLVLCSVCLADRGRSRYAFPGDADRRSGFRSPDTLQDLICWYDPNKGIPETSGTISVWADQSGNGFDLVEITSPPEAEAHTMPTVGLAAGINGKVVIFDGAQNGNALRAAFGEVFVQPQTKYVLFWLDDYSGDNTNNRFILDGDDETGGTSNANRQALYFKRQTIEIFAGGHIGKIHDADLSAAPAPRATTHITVTPIVVPGAAYIPVRVTDTVFFQSSDDIANSLEMSITNITLTTYEVPFTGGITSITDTAVTPRVSTVDEGKWVDLTLVYNGTDSSIYQDGILITKRYRTTWDLEGRGWSGITIGVRAFTNADTKYHFKGKIGGVIVVNHVSSGPEREEIRTWLRRNVR